MKYKIGDEIEFILYGLIQSGEIADISNEDIFVRIHDSQIFKIKLEDIK